MVEAARALGALGCGVGPSEVTGCCLWSQQRNCNLHNAEFPSGRRHKVWMGC